MVEPRFVPGLPDEAAGFRESVRNPIGAQPLARLVKARDRVAVVIPDLTRPLPSDRLLPWLFEELSHVPAGRFTIVNGTGSHRVNTPEELRSMVGPECWAATAWSTTPPTTPRRWRRRGSRATARPSS